MRRGSLFWGLIFVIGGAILLLDNLGFLRGLDIWSLIWPVFLILLGAWFLFGAIFRKSIKPENAVISLEGAQTARLKLVHGAGRMSLSAGAGSGNLLDGTFGSGVDTNADRQGSTMVARCSVPVTFFPFSFDPGSLDWNIRINRDVPLVIEIESGASESNLDLSDLQVKEISLKSGASSTSILLPASAGHTLVKIEAGAASVDIQIPEGVAGRIRSRSGISSINVDNNRFPLVGDVHESADYHTNLNKVEIEVVMGVGSVTVR